MKKLLSAVMALLLVFGLCVPAFADIGAPYFMEYEIRIINKDGVYLEGYNATEFIPYDTVLTVTGDFIEEDGSISYSVSYNDVWGTINGDDAIMLDDGVHYSEGVKLTNPKSYVVIREGAFLHKGPSDAYETVGSEIPVGTEFDCYYAIDTSSDCAWAYTTINGVGGWIYIYQYFYQTKVACKVNKYSNYGNDLFVAKEGVKLLDISGDTRQEIGEEIPVGTRLTFEYYIDSVKNILVQTEYNGVTGWISADEWFNDETDNKVAISKLTAFFINSGSYPIYKELCNTASEIIGTVEGNTMIKTIYACLSEYSVETYDYNYEYFESSWYGIEVDGQLGWINITQDWDREYIWEITQYTAAEDDVEIYSSADSSDIIGKIPAGKDLLKFNPGDSRSYISYDGTEGWVDNHKITQVVKNVDEYGNEQYHYHTLRDYYDGRLTPEYLEAIRLGKELVVEEEEEDDGLTPPPEEVEATTRKKNKKNSDEKDSSFSQTQLIILCAAGVAIVAATAVIIIVLINKKKKK